MESWEILSKTGYYKCACEKRLRFSLGHSDCHQLEKGQWCFTLNISGLDFFVLQFRSPPLCAVVEKKVMTFNLTAAS